MIRSTVLQNLTIFLEQELTKYLTQKHLNYLTFQSFDNE